MINIPIILHFQTNCCKLQTYIKTMRTNHQNILYEKKSFCKITLFFDKIILNSTKSYQVNTYKPKNFKIKQYKNLIKI